MKKNYRKQPSCITCKIVAHGERGYWPQFWCNEDDSHNSDWLNAVWDMSDQDIKDMWEYTDIHEVHINGICDEYIEQEEDEK